MSTQPSASQSPSSSPSLSFSSPLMEMLVKPDPEAGEYIAIVGSRGFPEDVVWAWLEANHHWIGKIVSGECPDSPDMIAKEAAKRYGIPYWGMPPKKPKAGDGSPYFRRNVAIALAVRRVVAFWDGSSHGTKTCINAARSRGKTITVYGPDGGLIEHQQGV